MHKSLHIFLCIALAMLATCNCAAANASESLGSTNLICERVDPNGDLYFKALSFNGRWIPNQINGLEEGNTIYWYSETKYSDRTNALYEKSYRRKMVFEGYDELHSLLSIGFRERGNNPLIFRDNDNYMWGTSVRGPWTNMLDRKTLALRENYRYLDITRNGENKI
ncbi:MAG: hypothetical protein ACI9R8_001946 [Candidatus Paceibacteria bacterium]|jgi:hypothetical protein